MLLVVSIVAPVEAATSWSTYRIMLDPGHGGTDPGASGPSAPHEATLVLRCANALQTRIVNECGGTVKMTRSTDTFISLTARREASVSYDPYIFCSIHLNAYNTTAKGTETYYYWSTGNSYLLATKVHAQLISQLSTVSGFTPTNRGVKYGNLAVIKGSSSVPAILTEGLFVDNTTEWSIINDESKDGFKKWVQGHLYGFYDRLVLLKSDIIDPSGTTTETTTPTMTLNPTSMSFNCVAGESLTNSVAVTGSNLTATPTATISGTGFSISAKSLGSSGGSVTVKFAPTEAGNYSGTLTLTSGTLTQTVSLTGTATAPALTFEEGWNFSDYSGTLTSGGWDAGKVRNMTYNAGKLYLVYNHSDIKVVNAQTGADLGNLNKKDVAGGVLTLCDVKCCDGKIVACNLATEDEGKEELRVYVWDDDQENPRLLLSTTEKGGANRIGDCIGFYGTWESGKLVFGRDDGEVNSIIEYAITDGVCATTPTVITVTTDGSTRLAANSSIRVYPDADGYWLDGKDNYTTRLDATGKREFYIDADVSWGNAFEPFVWQGVQYAVTMTYDPMLGENWSSQTDEQKALNYTAGRMKLLMKEDGSEWTAAVDCGDYPSTGLSSSVQNTNCTGNVVVAVNGTTGVEAWVVSTGQGVAYYKYGTTPTNEVEEIVPIIPSVSASSTSVSLKSVIGNSDEAAITVSGKNLEGDINIEVSGDNADMFTISTNTIDQATASGTVTITYSPRELGTHTATLTISSTNASDVTVTLTGEATEEIIVLGTGTLTQDWAVTEDILTAQTVSRWASGWDGKIYVNDYENSVLYYYTKDGKTQVGSSAAGTAIAHDDAGNIILGTTIWTAAADSWKILPAGSTTFQDMSVTLPDGVTTQYIQYIGHVAGNMMSDNGGALFLFPNTQTSVAKILIKNGTQASAEAIEVETITADAQSFAVPLTSDPTSNDIAVRLRSNNHFYHHNGTEFVAYDDNGINKTQGGTFFTLNGTLYNVQPIGTNYLDGFQVVDIDNNEVVASHNAELEEAAHSPNANCISAQVTGDYEATLYQYVPGQLAAQYTFKLDVTTKVDEVKDGTIADEAVSTEYYNLQGIRMMNPERGLYLKKVTTASGKTIVSKVIK